MLFVPFAVLGMWVRGLLAVAVLVGAGTLLARWYRDLPDHDIIVVTRDGERHERREPLGPVERIARWRPAADVATALLTGGAALLAVALLGGVASGRLLSRPGGDPYADRGGSVHRLRRPDGTELYVETHGPADLPTVVATHGWGVDGSEWRHLRDALAGHARLVVWDLPGNGRSSRAPGGDYSTERLAADLAAVIDHAGGGPVVLVGHSIGGMTTLTHCRLHPEDIGRRVAGLVLVHTSYTNPVRTAAWGRLYTALERPVLVPLLHLTVWLSPLVWLMNVLSYFNGSAHRSVYRMSFAGNQTRAQLDHMARFSLTNSPGVLARGMLGMLRYDATAVLPALAVPTLVVTGDRDPLTPPAPHRVIAGAVPGSRLVEQVPARHQGHFERHAEFTTAVREFVAAAVRGG